jgi:hypothetical protein
MRVDFSTADPGGTIGQNPFRYKVELFLNGSTVIASAAAQLSSTSFVPFFYGTPIVSGQYQAKILFQKFNVFGWVNVGTYWTNIINVNLCPPPPLCPTNITITGAYAIPLTQSGTWIKSSGSTIIPGTATVKLDADPVSGYAELNPGFEAQPSVGAVFVAQALDGCGAGVPMRPAFGSTTEKSETVYQKEKQPVLTGITVYPNPTRDVIVVHHNRDVKILEIFNATGVLVARVNTSNSNATKINLAANPAGVYILQADGKIASRIIKQ